MIYRSNEKDNHVVNKWKGQWYRKLMKVHISITNAKVFKRGTYKLTGQYSLAEMCTFVFIINGSK